MRGMLMAATATLALGLSACVEAPSPESIAPTQVSVLNYQRMDCRALAVRINQMDRRLADLYAQQRKAEANDRYGLLYGLHPRASIVGPDLVPTIALAKGERLAANEVLSTRC